MHNHAKEDQARSERRNNIDKKENEYSKEIKTKSLIRRSGFWGGYVFALVFIIINTEKSVGLNAESFFYVYLLAPFVVGSVWGFGIVETIRRCIPSQRKLDMMLQDFNEERLRNGVEVKNDLWRTLYWLWVVTAIVMAIAISAGP